MRDYQDALAETVRFAGKIVFSLEDLKYQYPDEPVPPGRTAQEHLEYLTWAGTYRYFPDGIDENTRNNLFKELALIAKLNYAHYFLTVHDIVHYARSQNILCQGRGSAANSAVCFMLGVTSVNPQEINLLFERFLSEERLEPPDIDVDFEHNRREEVMQYVYRRYGRHRAAIIATVIHYRPRSAIRDVGKALGLTEDITGSLADTVWGSWGDGYTRQQLQQAGLDPNNPMIGRAIELATELIGFPRHLSQHVGGYVLTQDQLDTYVPIGNAAMEYRTFIEWDKDDVDAMRMMKVDVLALGMLTCIRKSFDLIDEHKGKRYELADIKGEDERRRLPDAAAGRVARRVPGREPGADEHAAAAEAKDVLRSRHRGRDRASRTDPGRHGASLSEAQERRGARRFFPLPIPRVWREERAGADPRKNPRRAAVPGAGDADRHRGGEIHARRGQPAAQGDGDVPPQRHHPQVRRQDDQQADRARLSGGFCAQLLQPDQGIWRVRLSGKPCGELCKAGLCLVLAETSSSGRVLLRAVELAADGILRAGADRRATRARTASWCARSTSPSALPTTRWKSDAAKYHALRLGFRQIDGFAYVDPDDYIEPDKKEEETRKRAANDWSKRIVEARKLRPFSSLEDFARATALPKRALILLADADAFRSLGLDRRAALWAVRRLPDDIPLPLFTAALAREQPDERAEPLPAMPLPEHVVADYQTIRLSIKGHPMEFLRRMFLQEGIKSCRDATELADGRYTRCAGVVLVRQRPGTAKGTVFMTIEDETGIANIVVWPKKMQQYRKEVMGARLVLIEGKVQKSVEGVTHIVAERLIDRTFEMGRLSDGSLDQRAALPAAPALIEPVEGDEIHPRYDKSRMPRRTPSAQRPHPAAVAGFSLRRPSRYRLNNRILSPHPRSPA